MVSNMFMLSLEKLLLSTQISSIVKLTHGNLWITFICIFNRSMFYFGWIRALEIPL